MAVPPAFRGKSLQFGAFELRVEACELLKHGVRIRLQEQPLTLLACLLENPGAVVPREELNRRIWAEGTFVDYEHGLNAAVTRLRQALGDTAEAPRYVETIPRKGYRFIAPVTLVGPPKLDDSRSTKLETPATGKQRRFGVVATACGTCLVLALGAGLWLRSPSESRAVQLTPLPLTAAPGYEFNPDFSPDGAQVAYNWDEGKKNTSHIFVKFIGPGKPLQVTVGPGLDFVPAWSPDGRAIAFVRVLDQRTAIYIIPSLGGGERKVADVHVSEGRLSWSPDGRSLVMGERNGASESQSLYLIAAENGERFRLTKALDAQTRDLNPVFRPNGRDLLFTRCASYIHCGLYLQELSKDYRPTAKPRILKEESGYIKGAAWTTSGQEVVYAVSDDAGLNPRLKRTRVGDTAFTEQLTYAGEHLLSPVIARTGNRLAYAQDLSDVDMWQVEIGKQPRTFASSTRFEYAPQYAPDGKHVAFSSDRSGQMQIWICDADGGNPIQLTHFEEHTGTPRWSADGRWIAFDRHVKEGFHIFVMASDGGQVRKLTSDEGDEAVPSWSTDGNWIYYSSNRTGRYEIWRAPAKGGKASQVTRSGGFVAFESHDGKFLYYTKVFGDASPSGLWELPLAGGEERLVLESVQTRAFAVENGGIYYISAPAPDGSSLRFHNLATRKDQGIVSIQAETFQGLTVSPDRKTFLFSGFTRTGSNVMVVEHFR